MGGPVSVAFSDIFMCKMEEDVVVPAKPIFYKRCIDDTFNIIWNTRKIQSLFNNKDKVQHLSCVIYKGVCSCGADYIGETIRNVEIRWNEHESGIDKNSECFKHFQEHLSHGFQWSVLSIAPRNTLKWKILEAYFIKIMVSSLNNQMNSDVLTLFRNGIT